MDSVKLDMEYRKAIKKFEKYQKDGIDLAFRCNRCNKLVFQADILHGVGCTRCGSMRIYPITQSLTKFGVIWCLFWNKIHDRRLSKRTEEIQ